MAELAEALIRGSLAERPRIAAMKPARPLLRALGPAGLLLAVTLAACGGGAADEDTWAEAAARADAQEAEARKLGVVVPCSRDAQCGVLVFMRTEPSCTPLKYHVYSLAASTAAAASAAATKQIQLAFIAYGLSPNTDVPCPSLAGWIPPVPVCRANTCVAP